MANLLDRMNKAGALKGCLIEQSAVFAKDRTPTPIPLLNFVLSGDLAGGMTSGLTGIAGESKSFKTMLGWCLVAAYQKKHKDGICVMYDSEFGSPPEYISAMGVDPARVYHVPVLNIEDLKFDIVQKLEELNRGDKVMFFLDSLGNLASKKEVEDAKNDKSVTDMTRAKAIKSMFRIITPYFSIKDIPMVFINHIYMEQGSMYPKAIVSGGTGVMLSSDTLLIMKKTQIKEGTEVTGYDFGMFVEKSRYIKEKSRLPLTVTYSGGIDPWSGFFQLASDLGYLKSPSQGWYSRCMVDPKTGEQTMEAKKTRKKDTDNMEYWQELFKMSNFAEAIQRRYRLPIAGTNETRGEDLVKFLDSVESFQGVAPLAAGIEEEEAA